MKYPKRLIEVDLPIRAISKHARKDKNIRKGHLRNMHIWWATRPLASCRAVILATILPDPADPQCQRAFIKESQVVLKEFTGRDLSDPLILRRSLLDFIADCSAWDAGVNPTYVNAIRRLVAAAHPENAPLILDPFAGAGSIPFEALRVGAQSFASDLNPVAVLLNKVSQEYLPKYGLHLTESVEKWGEWILEQARKKLAKYYPTDAKGNIPLAYMWARTIQCEGPKCGAEVPMLGMLWLSQKEKKRVAFRYRGEKKTKQVHIDIFKPKSEAELQEPLTKRFSVTCPVCQFTTPYKNVRNQLHRKNGCTYGARLLAVIEITPNGARSFRIPNANDIALTRKVERLIMALQREHNGDLSILPDESTPECRGSGASRAFSIQRYGMNKWSDLYMPRQALSLVTFCELVSDAHSRIEKETSDAGIAKAVTTCLGLTVSNMSHYLSSLSIYALDHMISAFVQGSGLAMRPDFAESNPLIPKLVGGFDYALGQMLAVLRRESTIQLQIGTVQQGSAVSIPLPNDSVSYLVTDPPYYDAVPYAALSDFCYVWLKRSIGLLYPDLFSSKLTPKAEECILDPGSPAEGELNKDRGYFESTIQAALTDARRVLKPDGIGIVIFAHKGTAGWEALLNALISAGWTVTASWPIDTERSARLRAKNSAVLGSSVHLVCRPRENPDGSLRVDDVGDWRDVLAELPKRIHEWLPKLNAEGIVGADAIFACLGPALEIYSQYSTVERANGEKVELGEFLKEVWAAISKEALSTIFRDVDATGFEEDSRLTAMWLWTLSAKLNGDEDGKATSGTGYALEYDVARKIAQGLGVYLDKLGHIVEIKGDKSRLLPVVERTKYLFGKEGTEPTKYKRKKKSPQLGMSFIEELEKAEEYAKFEGTFVANLGKTVLDQLHQCMILFAAGRSEAMKRLIVEESVGRDQRFWNLAQALSALYPKNVDEKRWVDGVLARKKSFGF